MRARWFVVRGAVALLAALTGLAVAAIPAAAVDEPPTMSISGGSVVEGDSGVNGITFTVTVTGEHSGVFAEYRTVAGTADQRASGSNCVAGSGDYLEQFGSVSFLSAETERTILITTCGDALDEPDETFTVELFSPSSGLVLASSSAGGTIIDDDDQPRLTIANSTFTEGNAGSAPATAAVSLTAPSGRDVTFNYATQTTGTATRGAACGGGVDYVTTTGSSTIPKGSTTPTPPVTVPVCGDAADEPNETFFVRLSSVVNADPPSGDGRVTITDNDATTALVQVNDVTVSEGASPARARFVVSLTGAAGPVVTFNYATANGTATGGASCTAGVDYVTRTGSGSFQPGVTTANVDVTLCNDTVDEVDQTFFLNITSQAGAAGIQDNQGRATITDNDAPPTLSVVSSLRRSEGDTGTPSMAVLALLLANGSRQASERTVTFTFATANGTAIAGTCGTGGADYQAVNRTVTFNPGTSLVSIGIPMCGDTVIEASETLTWTISNVVNATAPSSPTGTGVIVNDDGPDVSVVDGFVTEGNSGLKNFALTFRLSSAAPQAGSITYTLGGVPNRGEPVIPFCEPGIDYNARSPRTLAVPAGATQVTANLVICGDTAFENDEDIVVNVQQGDFVGIADGQGVVKILTDEFVEGISDLSPEVATVAPRERLTYQFGWEVPQPLVWRDLANLQLRLVGDDGTNVWLRWDEADDSLHLVGARKSGHPGEDRHLSGRNVKLHLDDSATVGSGPTGQSVVLTLSLELKQAAAGETYVVEVAAQLDGDTGAPEFHRAGEVTVTG